jgi:hypothetical protein
MPEPSPPRPSPFTPLADIPWRTDRGQFRDKVAVHDPAMVSWDADGEAGGAPTPPDIEAAEASREAAMARRHVLSLDRDRAVSTADFPFLGATRWQIALALTLSLAGTVAFVGVALDLTLP